MAKQMTIDESASEAGEKVSSLSSKLNLKRYIGSNIVRIALTCSLIALCCPAVMQSDGSGK